MRTVLVLATLVPAGLPAVAKLLLGGFQSRSTLGFHPRDRDKSLSDIACCGALHV
jgi:hypothetical protein